MESGRAESLLAHLLLHRDAPQPRQRLAFLLWPDSTESQARTNLRHVLHNLRRALPDADRFIEVTPRTLQWRPDAPCWLDVAAFEELLARAEDAQDGGVAALREAVATYGGDLLEGSYDDWVLDERERLRQRHLASLERLAALLHAQGDHAGAIAAAERLVRHDPLREETYRLLMRLHDARGDRSRALRAYHECSAILERELGVEPSAATRDAYHALLPLEGEERDGGRVGAASLVGRAAERRRLTERWRAAEAGRSGMALVTGEPGVGKTRLVEELRSWCSHRGAVTAVARAYQAEGALAYAPVVEWLRSESIAARLDRVGPAAAGDIARLLPELAGAPEPGPLPEEEGRQRLFDAAARALVAAGAPLLLVADDLQWWDRESLRFLHYLLRAHPGAPLLVAATARREDLDEGGAAAELVAGLTALERLEELGLERLSAAETALLGERVAGRQLDAGEAALLHRATEGNPLFVLEALRAGWTDAEDDGWMTPRVQAVIESRIARLTEPARDLLGVAATVGREVTADLLAAASDAGDEALVRALDELWRRRILRERGADAYDFSHDRIREVAERGLSPARRRRTNRRVAEALERLHASDAGPVSGRLADHWERAGESGRAIDWYERAAAQAQRVHAYPETARLLERALALLSERPVDAGRDARELSLLEPLVTPLGSVEGFGSERLARVRARALELARALGVEPSPRLLRATAIASLTAGDLEEARAVGERLRAQGERERDEALVVEGAYVLGIAAFWGGEPAAARRHFEAAVARHRTGHRPAHLFNYGLDPQAVCRSRLANALWLLGRGDDAARARDAALELSAAIGHAGTREVVLVFAALLAIDMGEPELARLHAGELSGGHGAPDFRATRLISLALEGYVVVLDGDRAGLARIRRALEEAGEEDHAPGMRACLWRVLVEACAEAGDARGGLEAAERALGLGGAAQVWESEFRRRRALFLHGLGAPREEVGAELARALAVARRQGAAGLEARARESADALA